MEKLKFMKYVEAKGLQALAERGLVDATIEGGHVKLEVDSGRSLVSVNVDGVCFFRIAGASSITSTLAGEEPR